MKTIMADQWHYFPCAIGEDQAFIYVNAALRDSIGQAPALLARLRLIYKAPRDNGLPTADEFEAVSEIEDRIDEFARSGGDWYVGRVTMAGQRRFYVYTSRAEDAWNDFLKELTSDSGYEIKLEMRDDSRHLGYFEELYPTEDDWQVIKDLQVIEQLEKHGDDGSVSRKVDHWIYFPDKESSVDFVRWAEEAGFVEEAEYSGQREDGQYCVRLYHHASVTVGEITRHTIALGGKAREHGGEYDGWETEIVNSG
jgi:hypothetical protein